MMTKKNKIKNKKNQLTAQRNFVENQGAWGRPQSHSLPETEFNASVKIRQLRRHHLKVTKQLGYSKVSAFR